ncbi:unnamed protein product [Lampetra planeri]
MRVARAPGAARLGAATAAPRTESPGQQRQACPAPMRARCGTVSVTLSARARRDSAVTLRRGQCRRVSHRHQAAVELAASGWSRDHEIVARPCGGDCSAARPSLGS